MSSTARPRFADDEPPPSTQSYSLPAPLHDDRSAGAAAAAAAAFTRSAGSDAHVRTLEHERHALLEQVQRSQNEADRSAALWREERHAAAQLGERAPREQQHQLSQTAAERGEIQAVTGALVRVQDVLRGQEARAQHDAEELARLRASMGGADQAVADAHSRAGAYAAQVSESAAHYAEARQQLEAWKARALAAEARLAGSEARAASAERRAGEAAVAIANLELSREQMDKTFRSLLALNEQLVAKARVQEDAARRQRARRPTPETGKKPPWVPNSERPDWQKSLRDERRGGGRRKQPRKQPVPRRPSSAPSTRGADVSLAEELAALNAQADALRAAADLGSMDADDEAATQRALRAVLLSMQDKIGGASGLREPPQRPAVLT